MNCLCAFYGIKKEPKHSCKIKNYELINYILDLVLYISKLDLLF